MNDWRELDWDKIKTVDDLKVLLNICIPSLAGSETGLVIRFNVARQPEIEYLCKEKAEPSE